MSPKWIKSLFKLPSLEVFHLLVLVGLLHSQTLAMSVPQNFSKPSILASKFIESAVHSFKLLPTGLSERRELPKVFIQAGLHGDETETVSFAYWLMERIRTNKGPLARLNSQVTIDILPVANPGGYKLASRNNPKDINLNRNFSVFHGKSVDPKIGEHSFSERETSRIRKLFLKNKYSLAIDIHGYVPWLVLPTSPEAVKANASEYYTTKKHRRYKEFAKIAKKLKTEKLSSNYKVVTPFELGDGGSFEDWAFWQHDALSLCFEMESQLAAQNVDTWEKYESYLAELISNSIDKALI